MNLPDRCEKDPMDRFLGAELKRWVAREKPPREGLARLLWSAAAQKPRTSLGRIDSFRRWLMTDSGRRLDGIFIESILYQPKISYLQLNFLSVC
jgi:hypothetical protein